jgi:hypothetical protein
MAKPPDKSSRLSPALGKGWLPSTLLGDLNIPHLPVVLTEVFCLLPPELGGEPWPQTIGALADTAALTFEQVRRKLREAQMLSADIVRNLSEAQLVQDAYWLQLGNGAAPLSAHPLDPQKFEEQFATMQAAPAVFVLAAESDRAFSATMYLRSEGIKHAYAIC